MAKQTLIKQIKEATQTDTCGRKKNGNIIVRRGYFYSGGKTSEDLARKVQSDLDNAGIKNAIVNHGSHWTTFSGGASVAKSTHWWVEIEGDTV